MKFSSAALVASAASLALASPTPTKTLAERAAICGQWDTVATGTYTLYNDLWGEAAGTGSQCSAVNSVSGNTISWYTSWSWSGGSSSVKSFADVGKTFTAEIVSTLTSLATTWNYSYSGTSIVADVAYDIFTGSTTSTSAPNYEIMVWLAALGGAGPISSTGSPIATVTIDGHSFNLYYGLNGSVKVYSFVATSQITAFSGDLLDFFDYLTSSQGFPATSQYLQSIQAGTEPFTGSSATLTTSAYSVVVQ